MLFLLLVVVWRRYGRFCCIYLFKRILQLPTSLLAQVDAAIGKKQGLIIHQVKTL